MIAGIAGNAILGSALKIAGYVFGKYLESKREKDLATANAEIDKIKAVQAGEDKADVWTKGTRRLLAFMLTATACFIVIWLTYQHPQEIFKMQVDKDSGFFGFLFGGKNVTTIDVSTMTIVVTYFELFALIVGFYFTKVGK
jgi:hypothetical protein